MTFHVPFFLGLFDIVGKDGKRNSQAENDAKDDWRRPSPLTPRATVQKQMTGDESREQTNPNPNPKRGPSHPLPILGPILHHGACSQPLLL